MADTLVTLFTDAGYCPRTRKAVWAAWAKCDGKTMRRSGILAGEYATSGEAEAAAIANGLHCVSVTFDLSEGPRIIVQSDSLEALNAISGKLSKKRAIVRYAPQNEVISRLVARHGLTLDLRHVPGHQGRINPRQAVNTWCDQACRARLKEARASADAAVSDA